MVHTTPVRAIAKWVVGPLSALDRRVFFADELRATAKGWRVGRPRPVTRTYRDPRWDQVGRARGGSADSPVSTDALDGRHGSRR
jgi:hypothetical protein